MCEDHWIIPSPRLFRSQRVTQRCSQDLNTLLRQSLPIQARVAVDIPAGYKRRLP